MSLFEVYAGQQTWTSYVSNRDLASRFEQSLTKAGDRMALQLNHGEQGTAVLEGLGAIENSLTSEIGDLQYELQNISAGIGGLRADFHILMGDIAWKLERQTATLKEILWTLQAPLDTASKELRARAEDAYRNGWYEEALADFLQSEQKNYQDFAVHRSIGNIHLYHLVDLQKAAEYFQKAAKYARPRDTKQAAEAEYFSGVTFGLQRDFNSALNHMREATSLDPAFCDAYYSCATFAMLLGHNTIVLQSLERAIIGDARYFERCLHDPCFDGLRDQINSLLARLRATEDGESNSRIAKLEQTIQRLRGMGVAESVLQDHSTQLQEIENTKQQGSYLLLRLATTRAYEALETLLSRGIESLEKAAKNLNSQKVDRTSELKRSIRQADEEREATKGEMQSCALPLSVIGLIIGVILLINCMPPFSNVLSGSLSVIGLIIGTVFAWFGGKSILRYIKLDSKAQALASQAGLDRDRLRPGVDDFLQKLDYQHTAIEQSIFEIRNLLSDISARKPAKLLPFDTTTSAAPTRDGIAAFTITLVNRGPNIINAIKVVREVTGLGMKDAKDLVETVPSTIKAGVAMQELDGVRKAFDAISATIRVSPDA